MGIMDCLACPGSDSSKAVAAGREEDDVEDAWTMLCGWAWAWAWPAGMVAAGVLHGAFCRPRRPPSAGRIQHGLKVASTHVGAVSLGWVYVAWLLLCCVLHGRADRSVHLC